jgi:hypothetical protein
MATDRWFSVNITVFEQQDGAAFLRDRSTYRSQTSLEAAVRRYGVDTIRKTLQEQIAQLDSNPHCLRPVHPMKGKPHVLVEETALQVKQGDHDCAIRVANDGWLVVHKDGSVSDQYHKPVPGVKREIVDGRAIYLWLPYGDS